MTTAKRFLRRAAAAAVCAVLCVLCLPASVRAYGPIEDRTCSLTVSHLRDHTEARFRLYRVAEVSADVEFTATRDFREYQSRLNGQTDSGWRSLARQMGADAIYYGTPYLDRRSAGANGQLTFSGLSTGLYLVVGERYQHDGAYYEPMPFLICLPNWEKPYESGAGRWNYDVTVRPKYSVSEEETVMRRVLKIWDDRGHTHQRPREVTVDLLRDGVVWDTVTLTERNSWRYVWENLDNRYTWTIRERAVSGYWPTYGFEGVTFTILNTYDTPPDTSNPPPGNPENPRNPGRPYNPPDDGTELEDPDVPLAPPPDTELDDPDVPLSPPPEEVELDDPDIPLEDLPHTGQLWWPVPLLAVGGMFLFLLGWVRNRREEADAE